MESGPPLNLTTSVKVEDSVIKCTSEKKSELIKEQLVHRSEGDPNFVILQPLTSNGNGQVLAITSECVKDIPEENKSKLEGEESSNKDEIPKTETYKCSHCKEIFFRASQLRVHEKAHSGGEKIHVCEQCFEIFPRLSLLLCHKQVHTKRSYECPECDQPMTSYRTFRMHMKKHKKEKRLHCSDCSMTFLQQSHLITHKRKHTGEKPYVCHICQTRFKQISHLNTHLRIHTKDKPYVCEYCSARFSQTGSLKRHTRSHTGEKPFKCKDCNAVFVEKRNLQRHLLSHSGIRPHKCDLCSASFTQFIDLKRHKFSHAGFKPYKCDVCEAAFSRKNNLKWHRLTHEGNTPHKCEVCNVGFKIGRDLKNHKRSHIENRPYSCDQCNASFLQLTTLKKHAVIHSGCKPYSCEQCKAKFFEKGSLKRHIQRHEAVKPYSCDHCMSSFLCANTLKRHKYVVHKEGNYNDCESKPSDLSAKQNSEKKTSSTVEEENSLHIYEPYQKGSEVAQSTLLPHGQPQELTKEPTELPQTACEVIMCGGNSENSQVPTLVLSQPGQPPKTGKLSENCQNHQSHIHTLLEGSYSQWQTWCFCDTPNIPNSDPLSLSQRESHDIGIQSSSQAISQQSNVNLSYQTSQQPICNTLQNIQPPLNQTDVSHGHTLLEEDIHNHGKQHPIQQTVYHSIGTNPTELQPSTGHFPQYNTEISPYSNDISVGPPEQSVVEAADASIHHSTLNQISDSSLTDKSVYIQSPQQFNMEANYNMPMSSTNFKKGVHQREEIKTLAAPVHPVHKETLHQVSGDNQKIQNSGNVYHQVIINEDSVIKSVEKFKQNKSNHSSKNENSSEISESKRSSHQNLSHDTLLKMQTEANYKLKTYKNVDMIQQSELPKENEYDTGRVDSTSVVTTLHSNASCNPNHPVGTNESSYQLPEFETPNAVPNEVAKESVTLQYSVTVNNPATGEIQIQSEMFPAKADTHEESSQKQPIKKRKVVKSSKKEKQYRCLVCCKAFLNSNQLELHKRKHTGEKPFVCGVCNQCFLHNNSLNVHMRSHTGERPFSCAYCNSTFTQKSNLSVHLRVHTGEKPFKCDVCETSFSQGSHLIAHKRIHNNDRPFVCSTCGQAFTQRSALKRHELKHSGLKPFSCGICQAKFSQKDDLTRHQTMHATKNVKVPNKRGGGRYLKKKENETKKTEDKTPDIKAEEKKSPVSKDKNNSSAENPKPEEKSSNSKLPKKSTNCKPLKAKQNIEPVRTSKRIKEAAEKKKFKTEEESDFITGDLEEIDRVEEMENHLQKVSRISSFRKKEVAAKNDSEQVQNWCFCEVPHGPNEPHTHTEDKFDQNYATSTQSASQNVTEDIQSNVLVSNGSYREGMLQLSIPPISQGVVMPDQMALQTSQHNHPLSSSTHISNNPECIVVGTSNMSNHQVLTSNTVVSEGNTIANHYLNTHEQISTSQDIQNSVIQDDGKMVYSAAQFVSGQILSAGHFVTPEGTIFIEAGDLIGNSTVVLNSSPGTFFFDISSEGQLLNVPMNANLGHDSVIVAGPSSIEVNPSSVPNDVTYAASAEHDSSKTVSFSVRDSQVGAILEREATHSPTVPSITVTGNPSILSAQEIASSTTTVTSTVASNGSPIHYTQMGGNEIGIFSTSLALDQTPPCSSSSSSVVTQPLKTGDKLQPVVLNLSKCSVCGKEFAVKNTMKQHMKSAHAGLHFCTVCFDAFTTKEHLIAHKLQHKSSHPCPECNQLFSSKVTLNQHRQKIHKIVTSKKGNKIIPCDRCKASFTNASDLNRHILGHAGVKPFKCKHCGASFTRKSSLNKHDRIHTGEKPYGCKECGVSFAYRYQINRHRSTHKEQQNDFSLPFVFS